MKFISILIGALMLASCGKKETGMEVQTAEVKRRDVVERVEGLGKVQPETEVNITSDVAGRIIELNGKPGDRVKKGDVLMRIDPTTYLANKKRAEFSYQSAQANLAKAEADLKRSQELFSKGFISQSQMDIDKANYEVQKAGLDQAKATLDEAVENLNKCTVRAPMNGIITIKNKEVGEIAQGSTFNLDIVMVVADLEKMETVVDITENDIVKVQLNQEVDLEVDAFPDTLFKGRVSEIANAANSTQGSSDVVTNFEVKIAIVDKNPAFRPGMNVTARIRTKSVDDVVTVPIQAVTARKAEAPKRQKSGEEANADQADVEKMDDSEVRDMIKSTNKLEEVVFVVVDGKVQKRNVVKGISDDDYYQIISGLQAGDEVVVGPFRTLSSRLKDGRRVTVNNDSRTAVAGN